MKIHALLLTAIAIYLISCEKTNKDFVGEYSFKNSDAVIVKNMRISLSNLRYSMLGSNKTKEKPRTTAKQFQVLSNYNLLLFIDESSKKLNGELEFESHTANNYKRNPTVQKRIVDMGLKNFRIINDTLWFSLSNQMTEMEGKTFKGFVYTTDETKYVGLEKEMIGSNDYNKQNPWFGESNETLVTFMSFSSNDSLVNFYTNQVNSLIDSLKNKELSPNAKHIIENSIDYLNDNFLNSVE